MTKSTSLSGWLLTVLCLVCCGRAQVVAGDAMVVTDPALRMRALGETIVPVRPGIPGARPFWNERAVQFMYAPAFDFKEVAGAKSYRFALTTVTGESLSFTADKPWAPLSPVWTKVPTGKTTLTVTGLDAQDKPVGAPMTRVFHRAAVIGREYPAPAMPWRESARTALDALAHSQDLRCWFISGTPDPAVHLYRYPSKNVGAAAAVLAIYATQTPAPADKEDALRAAYRAADYLLDISYPSNAVWAFHPPTYHPTMYGDMLKGHMGSGRYMTPNGADTAQYYLDIHDVTGNKKYLEAAVRIAETYVRNQRPDGSWLLFVSAQDGQPVTDNILVPIYVVAFLERLGKTTGDRRFEAVCARAVKWIEENTVPAWNWQGQFEDVLPQPPYVNMTKHEACTFAIHLFNTASDDPERRALALELLRFAEDQFVIWAQPPQARPGRQSADGEANAQTKGWMLPCVLEQYRCYAPVNASSAKLIRTYLAAYKVTGDRLHLEKARALAGTLTRTQNVGKADGRYLTWVKQPSGPMWFNCELAAIQAMQELIDCEARASAGK